MSLPAMHTAVGMSFPFLMGTIRFLKTGRVTRRLLLFVTFFMMVCGFWAEIPDMPRFLSPKYTYLEKEITGSRYANIFFFHGFLDTHQEEDRGLREGALAIFAMFFLILFACSRSVLANQKEIGYLISRRSPVPVAAPKRDIEFRDIVDIHCHVLPGVDDGPRTVEESLEMCGKMAKMGIRRVVATPHLPWKGVYDTDKVLGSYSCLKDQLERENIPLDVSLGADIRISWDLLDKLKEGQVFTIAGSRYFLLELDDHTVPAALEDFIGRCNAEGFYPVLTHPERNTVLQKDPERLGKIARMPALIQISSCSLVGMSGQKAKDVALELLKADMVDVIVSDAHSSDFRLDEFKEGLIVAQDIVGQKRVLRMASVVPGLVLNDADIGEIKPV